MRINPTFRSAFTIRGMHRHMGCPPNFGFVYPLPDPPLVTYRNRLIHDADFICAWSLPRKEEMQGFRFAVLSRPEEVALLTERSILGTLFCSLGQPC